MIDHRKLGRELDLFALRSADRRRACRSGCRPAPPPATP